MVKIKFNDLWKNHSYPEKPCDNKTFINQCAIRMGVALEKSGVDTTSFDKMYPHRRCYSGFKHNPRHILGAENLADWMKLNPIVFGIVKIFKQPKINDFYAKKGIIFIKNGWGSTDHIDLWNGFAMKGGFVEYLEIGEELWFWEFTV